MRDGLSALPFNIEVPFEIMLTAWARLERERDGTRQVASVAVEIGAGAFSAVSAKAYVEQAFAPSAAAWGRVALAGWAVHDSDSAMTRRTMAEGNAEPGAAGVGAPAAKRAFDIEVALRRIREAVAPFPKAAMFELAARGYDSVFEQVVACMISIRTLDEVTIPVALQLFEVARTPAQVAALAVGEIDRLI